MWRNKQIFKNFFTHICSFAAKWQIYYQLGNIFMAITETVEKQKKNEEVYNKLMNRYFFAVIYAPPSRSLSILECKTEDVW